MRPHRVASWGLTAYVAVLAAVALWPQPVDRPIGELLHRALRALHRRGIPDWVDYPLVESVSNVLLFVPLGALVAWIIGRSYWWVGAAAGLLTSCVIELAQLLFLPARVPTLADVLANTIGALLGALLVLPIMRRRRPVRNRAAARTL
ncbi:VanZ family protein [Arthrobacter sp. UKPF54-2]|uniref:VanZ family protein n=1 Tax=Arthrobacter sp. UKPF54-2 TaxID=2600159 RepID=UPI00164955D3|nr:VanZ family protein [Arthrobacter sp. UKPF54-2]